MRHGPTATLFTWPTDRKSGEWRETKDDATAVSRQTCVAVDRSYRDRSIITQTARARKISVVPKLELRRMLQPGRGRLVENGIRCQWLVSASLYCASWNHAFGSNSCIDKVLVNWKKQFWPAPACFHPSRASHTFACGKCCDRFIRERCS